MKIIIKEAVSKHEMFQIASDMLRMSRSGLPSSAPSKRQQPADTSSKAAEGTPTPNEPENKQPPASKPTYEQVKNTQPFIEWLKNTENKIADFWNKERQKNIGRNVRQRPSAPVKKQNENLIFEQQELSFEKWIESNKGEIKKYQNLIFVILPYNQSFDVSFIIPVPNIKVIDPSLKKHFKLLNRKTNIMKPAIYIGNKQIQRGKLGQIKTSMEEYLFIRFKQLANII